MEDITLAESYSAIYNHYLVYYEETPKEALKRRIKDLEREVKEHEKSSRRYNVRLQAHYQAAKDALKIRQRAEALAAINKMVCKKRRAGGRNYVKKADRRLQPQLF
jgi:hypothetical protein